MNQPSDASHSGRYVGKHLKPREKPARRGLLALLILLLCLARLGAEYLKGFALYRRYTAGDNLLIYGDVRSVELGDSLADAIPIYDSEPDSPPEDDDYIIRRDNGKTLIYQGHTYQLNENLVTVLVMGIDKELTDETSVAGKSGQADAIFLVALDTQTGKSTILAINRDTKAQVDEYSGSGQYLGTRFEQITLSFAYGDGGRTSCENTMSAVSRLLYGLPISTYLALDMDGVNAANETVGRVSLHSLQDIHMPDGTEVRAGDLIELHDLYLNRYIRTRSHDPDANKARMARQKQYVQEFAKVATQKARENYTFPIDLFSTLSPYMVTDLEVPDVTFLSTCFLTHDATFEYRSIDGRYSTKEEYVNEKPVFLVDELDLFRAVLEVFYLQVD